MSRQRFARPDRRIASRRNLLVAVLAGLIVLAVITAAVILWGHRGAATHLPRTVLPTNTGGDGQSLPPQPDDTGSHRPTAKPALAAQGLTGMRVVIPKLGIDSDVSTLGLNANRTLQVPVNPGLAGWWSGGTYPGMPGPAVIVGHLDSARGPAVFHRLRELNAGDRIEVGHPDGSVDRFAVTRLDTYAKNSFPTNLVYSNTRHPSLRLITCAGPYDKKTGYRDNLVVFADAIEHR